MTGKVVQVAGPAVDCEFPEGQIPLVHTAIRITSEGFNVPDPDRHHLRGAAAHRRRPRPHHRAAAHRRPGARHAGDQPRPSRWMVPVGPETLGPRAQRDRPAGGRDGPGERQECTTRFTARRPRSKTSRRASKCSRPASRSSTSSSPTCAAARSACSAARASARRSSFRN